MTATRGSNFCGGEMEFRGRAQPDTARSNIRPGRRHGSCAARGRSGVAAAPSAPSAAERAARLSERGCPGRC